MAKAKKSKSTGSKKFVRPQKGKILGGVCAAVANRFHINVNVVRIVFVALVFIAGPLMLLAYVLGWLLIPAQK